MKKVLLLPASIYVVIGGDVKLANFNCVTDFHAWLHVYVSGSGVASTN